MEQDDCPHCGDPHPAPCTWAETCAECSRTDVDMVRDRLCVDCDAEMKRAARKERRRIEEEGRGDWERDQQR
jgi:hypothetical protein